MSEPVVLHALGMVCALGDAPDVILRHLLAGSRAGMLWREDFLRERAVVLGSVQAALPATDTLPLQFRSRNNQLLLAALAQIREQVDTCIREFGTTRIAVVLGSSTSGISNGEQALSQRQADGTWSVDFLYQQQEMGNPAQCLAQVLGLQNVAYTISTACSSSGKALASARRLLQAGVCDAVLCGGVDSLCKMTVQGFAALESVAQGFCQPFAAGRDGINIGEGAALFLMTRTAPSMSTSTTASQVRLLGTGEASDGFHISAPDPEGVGAELAIRAALADAQLSAVDIHYLNLHGTATPKNDAMEAALVARVFGSQLPCSSSKPVTGHTLGAAGAIEAGLCWLLLSHHNADGFLPRHVSDGDYDTSLPALQLCTGSEIFPGARRIAMSNSFAFGGSNVSLIMDSVI